MRTKSLKCGCSESQNRDMAGPGPLDWYSLSEREAVLHDVRWRCVESISASVTAFVLLCHGQPAVINLMLFADLYFIIHVVTHTARLKVITSRSLSTASWSCCRPACCIAILRRIPRSRRSSPRYRRSKAKQQRSQRTLAIHRERSVGQ